MDAAKVAEIIPYLFARPREWLVTGRSKYTFDIPNEYLLEPFKSNPQLILERFPYLSNEGREIIRIKALDELPDLRDIANVDMNGTFSPFLYHHRKSSSILIKMLQNQKTPEDFLSACVYVRDRINSAMFAYAASVAVIHRDEPEIKNAFIPNLASTQPHFFLPSNIIHECRQQLVSFDATNRRSIEIPVQFSATDLEEEQRVAYFREDLGMNLHHWHFHLVYPHDGEGYRLTGTQLPSCINDEDSVVKKDRRGEIFYYMHQQMVARYNFERLSNKMARVRPLKDLREPIAQGFFPKLIDVNSSKTWPARQPHTTLRSLTRELEDTVIDINHMERITDRILASIDAGFVFKTVYDEDGKPTKDLEKILLDEEHGTEILGNIIESSCLSVNRDYYGDLHNMGHVASALIHDPDGRFKEGVSVMGTNQTAGRDPLFYRWHAHINDIFMAHKNTLKPYTTEELSFDGVKVTHIKVVTKDCKREDEFRTFFEQDEIDLSWGIDFARGEDDGPMYAIITHLQHKSFTYHIGYENSGEERDGTVRIFMAPKYDESSQEFAFIHQRSLFIELDRFVQRLQTGRHVFQRNSEDSSVTIPWAQTFRSMSHISVSKNQTWQTTTISEMDDKPGKGDPKAYCGCGWPAHLLIPRGKGEGLEADLFVMITDTAEDKVAEFTGDETEENCRDAMSYCGLKDSKYPDKKPMGFPFDRRPAAQPDLKEKVFKLKNFLTDNMKAKFVKIRFTRKEPPNCDAVEIQDSSDTTTATEYDTSLPPSSSSFTPLPSSLLRSTTGSAVATVNIDGTTAPVTSATSGTTGSVTSATSGTTGTATSAKSTTGSVTSATSGTTGSVTSATSGTTGTATSAKSTTAPVTSAKITTAPVTSATSGTTGTATSAKSTTAPVTSAKITTAPVTSATSGTTGSVTSATSGTTGSVTSAKSTTAGSVTSAKSTTGSVPSATSGTTGSVTSSKTTDKKI